MDDEIHKESVIEEAAILSPKHEQPGANVCLDSDRQKTEYLGWLAGRVAHNLNNLLTPILGYTELLLQKADPISDTHVFLVEIRNASMRAAGIVEDLISAGRQQIIQGSILDLNKFIRESENHIRDSMGIGGELRTELSISICNVRVDPQHFKRMVFNLINNSIEALRPGGRITIATEQVDVRDSQPSYNGQVDSTEKGEAVRPGRYCSISFSDNGSGMSPETQSHIFDPFFTTKTANKGLGLSAVLGMVKQNLGYISVKSALGNGCTVRILLPAFPF